MTIVQISLAVVFAIATVAILRVVSGFTKVVQEDQLVSKEERRRIYRRGATWYGIWMVSITGILVAVGTPISQSLTTGMLGILVLLGVAFDLKVNGRLPR